MENIGVGRHQTLQRPLAELSAFWRMTNLCISCSLWSCHTVWYGIVSIARWGH